MPRTQLNVRVPETTLAQIEELQRLGYESQSHAVIVAIDRLYTQEASNMFIEFQETHADAAMKVYEAQVAGDLLAIDIMRHVDKFGGDTKCELICRINGASVKTFWSPPGSYQEERMLDHAKRALVAIYRERDADE